MTDQHPGVTGVASEVVDALKTSPVLLLVVLLNMAFAGSAAYYLVHQEDQRAAGIAGLIALLDKCTMHTVPIEAMPYFKGKTQE